MVRFEIIRCTEWTVSDGSGIHSDSGLRTKHVRVFSPTRILTRQGSPKRFRKMNYRYPKGMMIQTHPEIFDLASD